MGGRRGGGVLHIGVEVYCTPVPMCNNDLPHPPRREITIYHFEAVKPFMLEVVVLLFPSWHSTVKVTNQTKSLYDITDKHRPRNECCVRSEEESLTHSLFNTQLSPPLLNEGLIQWNNTV